MSYCLNPKCPNPTDSANEYRRTCCQCGSDLLLEGRYRVIKPLAGGGVVKTFEIDDQGQCKVLKVLFENHPQEIALFKQKAKVLSRLNYPGLPKINPNGYFTYLPKGSDEAFHCLVMEKFDQPENILRKPNGQLVLIALGAKWEVTDSFVPKINEGQNVTRIVYHQYIPPEQTHGNPVPQSDFFALGRTFVYLLTGKPPSFYPENPRTGKLFWRECAPNISDEFGDLIDNLMAHSPDNRPQTPQAILQRLADLDLKQT
ncbi:MAG: serine/threonine protein kinase, partial [Planktothrix sp.]